MAGVACGFAASFLFILANLLDEVWHAERNVDEINAAFIQSRVSPGVT